MQTKRKFVYFQAALSLLVMSFCLSPNVLAQRGSGRLVGTWEISVTPLNGAPHNLSLITFNADGTMTEVSLQDLHPPVSSAGHGVWAHIEANKYAFSFKFFIVDPVGHLVCTARVRSTVTLDKDGDEWLSAPAHIDCTAPNGNTVFGFDLTATATRMPLDLLD